MRPADNGWHSMASGAASWNDLREAARYENPQSTSGGDIGGVLATKERGAVDYDQMSTNETISGRSSTISSRSEGIWGSKFRPDAAQQPQPAPSKPTNPTPKTSATAIPLPPSPEPSRAKETKPAREFELTVSRSLLNHQAYIERQGYYEGFNPDMKTLMAGDLKRRVPLEGYADCRLLREETPLRLRLKRKDEKRREVSLRGMWEEWKGERGEL